MLRLCLQSHCSQLLLLSSHQRMVCRGVATTVDLFYNDIYEVELPSMHRFPMMKYRLVRETLQKEYAFNSMVRFLSSPLATEEELSTTHSPMYIQRYLTGNMTELEVRRTGFPWSMEHVRRSTSSVGGTVAATRSLLNNPHALVAGHIAGGTHHAFYDYGEGFCIFSDIAVACNIALNENKRSIKQIMIVDLDVHQGNGNAALFQKRPEVFTFSMHCRDNYFSKKQSSDLDIELPAKCSDKEYLDILEDIIPRLLDDVKPQLVFYQAGVDIYAEDKLGKLSISRSGLQQRNRIVFDNLLRREIKSVTTMGGGYPKDLNPQSEPFRTLVNCHADVYRQCIESFQTYCLSRAS